MTTEPKHPIAAQSWWSAPTEHAAVDQDLTDQDLTQRQFPLRDLEQAALVIRTMLQQQLERTAVWASMTDDEQLAVLDHVANNLAQVLPYLGAADGPGELDALAVRAA